MPGLPEHPLVVELTRRFIIMAAVAMLLGTSSSLETFDFFATSYSIMDSDKVDTSRAGDYLQSSLTAGYKSPLLPQPRRGVTLTN